MASSLWQDFCPEAKNPGSIMNRHKKLCAAKCPQPIAPTLAIPDIQIFI